MEPNYFIGLDLGQSSEYTALAVLERTAQIVTKAPKQWAWIYAIRHLQRFAIGTPYTQVLSTVLQLTREPPLNKATLVMDQTSVGEPIVRLFRQSSLQISMRPVMIVVGHDGGRHDGCTSIPKRELASVLQLVLQDRRLQIATQLEHAQTLAGEFRNFRMKSTALMDEANAWREREHDDLVFAVGVAIWMAERHGAPDPDGPGVVAGGPVSIFEGEHWDWEQTFHY